MTDDGAYHTSAVMVPTAAGPAPAAEVTEFAATTLPGWPVLLGVIVDLDPERKAAMVSNMLVVLCSEHPTQPIVNTGTLYQ
jgi:hypothetical protein